MKLEIKNNLVVAHAANEEESLSLIRLAHSNGEKKTYKKRRTDTSVKKCEICGKGFKGIGGLKMHKRRTHDGDNWASTGKKRGDFPFNLK